MNHLAVFCGSSDGVSTAYREGAVQLGQALAKRHITLVYGGSSIGLMGAVADSVLENGGNVIGVIPKMLETKEISHPDITELVVVDSMHERKAKMAELADGFMALPGGTGTLEEFIEVFTWAQLGMHQKPCGLLNINHYYDPLISLIHHMADQAFLQEQFREMALVDNRPDALLDKFKSYEPPAVRTYINREQT
ncbi:TIGR00730 family Rossman fold protein [Virgibacillus ihumii]|uniref:LOG family protein n=1 Tax=Virgibacillus ihumii TaxID=2686091 RepID=UPI00157D3957|nr:TIGR00730 family Rossman fold protein [Virgibacillus ihumii]